MFSLISQKSQCVYWIDPKQLVALSRRTLTGSFALEVPAASLDALRLNCFSLMDPTDELILCRGDGMPPHVVSTYYLSLNPFSEITPDSMDALTLTDPTITAEQLRELLYSKAESVRCSDVRALRALVLSSGGGEAMTT
ncbi:hypothetical protein [Pseudomonas sp. GD03696]|uniref:hypothetical protein n=1 Tax=Pseudomonas sp. GD03696 TaxID=2975368 RepID=UPI002447FFDA|nr:hypothetical protein [Pseudomonas sp. GD03696]MDH1933306.1 hypothetical protein [Pseudomonas sp. GD03696]